ncbi:MAG: type II toxin-antitoxin system VapC family toxin [Chloroflexota bacterium]|nr:type II toxin-antitoxin system VapC family toxin [Chloroflexota bacterium]
MTVVIDASALVAALVDSGSDGRWATSLIARESLAGPEMLPAEVCNVLRRLELSGRLSAAEATLAYGDLQRLNLDLFSFAPFAHRIWELRGNFTSYNAWYVALAEALECPLATLDLRLIAARGAECEFLHPEAG